MKKFKTASTANHEKDLKDKNSCRMYEMEFQLKMKKERKSYSNQKISSSQFLYNRLTKLNDHYSTEKTNSFNALGKAGNNIINCANNVPHLKVPPRTNNDLIHLRLPINLQNKQISNETPKSIYNLNFRESIGSKNVINYESIEKAINTNNDRSYNSFKEEEKTNLALTIDNDYILNHLNFIEIWIDTDMAIDNKSLFSTIMNKYLKEFNQELIKKNLEIFSLSAINRMYIKLVKLSLLLIVIAKFVLNEFSTYEASIRFQLKKLFLNVSELYGVMGDLFIFDLLNSNIVDKKFGLIEKLRKIVKIPYANLLKIKPKNNSNLNEIIFQVTKNIDNNLIAQIKNFSISYFNYGFYQPIFNVVTELSKHIDKISIQKLVTIITECILFTFIKREVICNVNKGFPKGNQIEHLINPYYYPQIQIPFLPPLNDNTKQYTLLLDLDETLVHFFYTPSGGTFFIRPHMFEFLLTLSQMYEIVIFTASMKEYADNILNLIDPENTLISHRLYRQHTTLNEFGVSKDLTKIGRNLSKAIIVDNLVENFKAQPNNGFGIKTWTDDMNDTELLDLMRILKDIYLLKIEDVRIIIKKINEIVLKNGSNNSGIYTEIDIMKF